MNNEDTLVDKISKVYTHSCVPSIKRPGPNKVHCIIGGQSKNNDTYRPKVRRRTDLSKGNTYMWCQNLGKDTKPVNPIKV